jgi:hypothetical protein
LKDFHTVCSEKYCPDSEASGLMASGLTRLHCICMGIPCGQDTDWTISSRPNQSCSKIHLITMVRGRCLLFFKVKVYYRLTKYCFAGKPCEQDIDWTTMYQLSGSHNLVHYITMMRGQCLLFFKIKGQSFSINFRHYTMLSLLLLFLSCWTINRYSTCVNLHV